MKTNIISIGNSQGVIIPSMLLRQLNLSLNSSVQLEVKNGSIIIKSPPRQGWAEAAIKMHAAEDDFLLLEDSITDYDGKDWAW